MTRLPNEPRRLLDADGDSADAAASALLARLPEVREDLHARERVWRSLVRANRAPRPAWRTAWRTAAAFAGVAVVAIGLGVFLHARAGRDAPVAGSWVRTDKATQRVLSLARSAVTLEPSTVMRVEWLGRETVLRLSAGMLVAEVDPRQPGESFVVLTTNYRVTVKGTIFSVRETTPDDVAVSVSRGLVEVSGASGTWQVAAGQSWSSRPAEPGAEPVAGPDGATVASPKVEASPPATSSAPLRKVKAPQLVARVEAAPASVATAPTPVPAALPSASVAPPAPKPLQHALDLIHEQHYREAERVLVNLSAEGGASADLALYELADLRQRRLQDSVGALAALRSYRTRFPSGALVQEAEISMIQLELARPDAVAALTDIDRFLSAHPNSERGSEVQWLRGNLLQTRGEFTQALESYRRVEGPDHQADALYFAAACEERLGQNEAAAATLRTYLQRFPAGTHAADARRVLGEGP